MQLNIVSLLTNFDELQSLHEAGLDAENHDTEVSIFGYSLIRKDRNRNGGGDHLHTKRY